MHYASVAKYFKILVMDDMISVFIGFLKNNLYKTEKLFLSSALW